MIWRNHVTVTLCIRLTISRYVCAACLSVDGPAECAGRRQRRRCRGRRPCQNVYAGKQPLSEPETVAVANFIMQRRSSIRLYISLHSYSQLWLTPWGYTATPPVDNDDLVSRRASPLAELLYIGWSDVIYLWSQCDRHFVGQHVVLCVVKWWTFVSLFE